MQRQSFWLCPSTTSMPGAAGEVAGMDAKTMLEMSGKLTIPFPILRVLPTRGSPEFLLPPPENGKLCVPEPTTLLMLGIGLFGLAIRRNRK
ncbi:MAG TPA: hypothetical protein DCR97_01705 [Deltaproteobacteria bacterium]|nr:hypothetical protein [Deltaproteobacteria bacterium]